MVREKKHKQRAGSDFRIGEGVDAASVVDSGVDFCFYDKCPICPVVEGFCIGFWGRLGHLKGSSEVRGKGDRIAVDFDQFGGIILDTTGRVDVK